MSLQGFVDHCQAASAALMEFMEIYRYGGSVLSDYADQNQAEAEAARQYLETAATEIEAACKLSESVIKEVSDDVATTILAVTASAKRNTREFFECWHKNEPALLLAAVCERIKPELQPKDAQVYADECLLRVQREFDEKERPRDEFYDVVKLAEAEHGVYELTSKREIDRAVESAKRQVELLYPHSPRQKSTTLGNANKSKDKLISTLEAHKLLDVGRTTLMRWAEKAGVKTASRGYWLKSDIEFLNRTKGTEAINPDETES
ncbi:hypothetical protein OAH34_01045 [bacterium]|nr:hypothetical protein [bacterium]